MGLLLTGLILWIVMHILPASGAGMRSTMIGTIGEGPWKGLFALTVIGAITLMVFGWRSVDPSPLYTPPGFGLMLTTPLMILAVVLAGAANAKTNIKRFVRHPMLTGVIVWAIAHLMSNGDDRSLVLFGGLGLWALVMIPLINKRDGTRQKPEQLPTSGDIKLFAIGAVVFVVIIIAHPYFAGVAPFAIKNGM